MSENHKGTCFCGAVEVEVSGAPEGMGIIAIMNPVAPDRLDQ